MTHWFFIQLFKWLHFLVFFILSTLTSCCYNADSFKMRIISKSSTRRPLAYHGVFCTACFVFELFMTFKKCLFLSWPICSVFAYPLNGYGAYYTKECFCSEFWAVQSYWNFEPALQILKCLHEGVIELAQKCWRIVEVDCYRIGRASFDRWGRRYKLKLKKEQGRRKFHYIVL